MRDYMTAREFAEKHRPGLVAHNEEMGWTDHRFMDEAAFASKVEGELGLEPRYCERRGRVFHVGVLGWAFAPGRE